MRSPHPDSGTHALPHPERAHKEHGILFDVVVGLCVILIILAATKFLEHTVFGEAIEWTCYTILQHRLESENHVAILDISQLTPTSVSVGKEQVLFTSRAALKELVMEVAKQNPVAIGIDINFSGYRDKDRGYHDFSEQNESFFQACMTVKNIDQEVVPVFLGVNWSETRDPKNLLANPKFASLAAWIGRTNDVKANYRETITKDGQKLPTLSVALYDKLSAASAKHSHPAKSQHEWPEWLAKANFQMDVLGTNAFLIDFSSLPRIEDENRLRTIQTSVVEDQGKIFAGKIVLIGDASVGPGASASDSVVMPIFRKETIPGIYRHACAINTLAGAPLYELSHEARVGLDIVLSLLVLAPVTMIRWRYRNDVNRTFKKDHATILFTYVVLLVLLMLLWLTDSIRIMWLDFLLVVPFLIIHPAVEVAFIGHSEMLVKIGDLIMFDRHKADVKPNKS